MTDYQVAVRQTDDNDIEMGSGSGSETRNKQMTEQTIPASALSTCVDGSSCIKTETIYVDSPVPIPDDTPVSTNLDQIRKLCAETLGSAILVTIIVGSGIMAERLSPNDVGLQLLENGISVCCGLIGLIIMFGPVSGAHFNPCVSLIDYLDGDMSAIDCLLYSMCQIVGAIAGAILADIQFDEKISISSKDRDDSNLWLGEVIATVTLIMVIHGCVRTGQKSYVPFAVGTWVLSGHFFTSSTIFANPAVTIGRQFSNTFAGINPSSVLPFIAFQLLGTFIAYGLIRFFYPRKLSMKKDDNLYLRVCVQNAKRHGD